MHPKRRNEFVEAIKKLEEEALGDRAKEMFTLAGLGTAPEAQGKGYASALVQCLLAMADAEGRATSVVTTDAAGFYALHGFVLVGETWIAKDNPKYDGPPVPVRVLGACFRLLVLAMKHQDESSPLLQGSRADIEVRLLRTSETWRAVTASYNALLGDTEVQYFMVSAHTASPRQTRSHLEPRTRTSRGSGQYARSSSLAGCFTTGRVRGASSPWTTAPRLAGCSADGGLQRKREFNTAYMKLHGEAIGDREAEMMELCALATAPEKQGRGYASALMRAFNKMARSDARFSTSAEANIGVAAWLLTSDAAGFYEHHGFKVVAEDWIAQDNPEWHRGPIPIRIVSPLSRSCMRAR
ncbi:uncharacterized protein BXZ73DRAFT_44979 [Epithele typhae]|uniref:uncharacterized protein n=1 Tax=Epithele typhae TaxID=378194 RepID=UPI002007C88C|nr:uncharacterized protein BXZ73DRAFT_44979 [Epithele typhae]KAH9936895.1 hypothetical protein BXZ73DRAFT_44979 [Epithele typhae]